jgi:hypothetical protein
MAATFARDHHEMGLWTDPDGRLWVDESRHCWSPDGRLLTWCSSHGEEGGEGVRRNMYRLGNRWITDEEGEQLRRRWGGTPD